jgi:insulysin
MYAELVNDALTEYSYDASLAGLGYDFGSYDRGVFLAASGYNEKVRSPTTIFESWHLIGF